MTLETLNYTPYGAGKTLWHGDTWIYFELGNPRPALDLAESVESYILEEGFALRSRLGSGSAGSALSGGRTFLHGERLRDVIPSDGRMIHSTSVFFTHPVSEMELRLTLGGPEGPLFDAEAPWNSFLLRAGCQMDRSYLPDILAQIRDLSEAAQILAMPKKMYEMTKSLFETAGVERCIGIDDHRYKDDYFLNTPAFYFSRSEPCISSELLE